MSQDLFRILPTGLPGCLELQPRIHNDNRGRFVKVFQREAFDAEGLWNDFSEEFYSISHRGVIRGMHFQTPPADHVKLVYCIDGEVQDAVLDLRKGSPTYGRHALIQLSAQQGNMLYIPRGLAHGFCTLSDRATVVYKTSTSHSPEHDRGILWNSADIPWANGNPVVSDRDRTHPALDIFQSPFTYEPAP